VINQPVTTLLLVVPVGFCKRGGYRHQR